LALASIGCGIWKKHKVKGAFSGDSTHWRASNEIVLAAGTHLGHGEEGISSSSKKVGYTCNLKPKLKVSWKR